jgi:two-component system CheB/CheR fusion protein
MEPTASGGEPEAVQKFPIVGIGASAGGLEAFTQLLSHLPEDTGMAFVLVQHLDPDHPSQLTSLLSRATTMPVREVKNGMGIEPNHIYVIPPNANMNLSASKLKLTPRGKSPVPHPIDYFFCSLAKEQQSWAIGIILSGTGSDGAVGLKEIKGAGGITFAQDEKSARFSGMPLQAAGDSVDFILPPEKIALELARIGRDPYLALPQKTQTEAAEAATAKDFRRTLALLRSHTGVDFSQYRDTTIKRRIQRRMLVRTRHKLADYIELLERDRAEISALFDDVLINVTSFFRDPEMFEALKSRIFPEILKNDPHTIRVWIAGCSTGQEAYSLAIALLEFLEHRPNAPGIQIFATDISEAISIEKGRRGLYPESIESEVSPERLRRFFTKEDGSYRISKAIRDVCIFAKQNVTSDPPFSRMDLVCCRNLLIYLTPPLQRHIISTFHYALNPNGFLVLGNSETVGANSDLFELLDRKQKIYSKKNAAIRPFPHFAAQDLKSKPVAIGHAAPVHTSTPADFQKEADRILLGRFAPAGVLVNSNLEVLQFRGRTSPYLEPPSGEASFNLLKMARENLSLELGTAIREAKKKNSVVRRNVRLRDSDTIRKVNLEILPVKLSGSAENCFLVLFEDADKERAAAPPARKEIADKKISATEKDRELKQLRTELTAAREYLQAITEQQDAANEELKCANEEVLSSNEELQSTNEQLGTAKEELQSTNEELQTLNEELQTRNLELNQLNNDLSNLLAGVQIPILMLGNDLRVRRFNSAALELLDLKSAIVGRPIHSIDSPLITSSLENLLLEVIRKVTHKETEIRNRDGRWFSLRLHPYRTSDNRIDGVILAIVDIDELKRAHEKLLDYVNAIVDTVRAPLLVLNADLRINTANDAFCQMFQTSKSETENHLIYELGDNQWNIPELRKLLSEILSGKSVLKNFEVAQNFPAIGRRMMLLNARRLEQKTGTPPMILLSIEDITEWKQMEEINHWLAAIVESSDDAIIGKDLNGIIISCNRGASKLFGYEAKELIGKPVTMLVPKERRDEESKILERIRRGESIEHYETVRQRKDGSLLDVSLTISPVKDLQGKIIGASKIAHDITERKHAEKTLEASLQREKAARQGAEAASRAKDDFLAALSHELRTPLNPVLLIASDAAKNRELPPGVRANFEGIRKNIELEARLIDDLLDLTRIASGKLSLDMREVDAHTILRDAIADIRADAAAKQIQLNLKLKAKRHQVHGDAVRLQQVFWNILKNAVKFTPSKGKITVETSVGDDGKNFAVKITDTGIGLTAEELERIFRPFSQGDHASASSHRFGGLGLGLAISRQIVELHSGRIQAGSDGRNKGSAFTIELPVAKKENKSSSLVKTVSKDLSSGQKTKGNGARILLVEDHEPTRDALTVLLLRRHYKIFAASSLAEARKIADEEKIDFVISDIGLPDGNGNDLMTDLCERYDLRGIALTGYGMEQDVKRSLAAGFVTHLTKPVHVQSLEKALASVL